MSNKHDLPPLPDIRDIVAVAHTKYCLDKYKSFEEAMFQETARAVRAQFAEHIQRLEAENEALKKDAERLDAIERNARCDPKLDGNHVWWPTTWKLQLTGPTLRAAIDAAMTKEQET